MVYEYKNTSTNEVYTLTQTWEEKKQYLIDNPDARTYFGKMPGFISGTGLEGKSDDGWKENLSRIAAAHPQSALAEKVGGRSVKEAKKASILKKHGLDKKSNYNMGDM
jgi:hypothetical protein